MYTIRRLEDLEEVKGECGHVKELSSGDSEQVSVAVVRIDSETAKHKHNKCMEIYFVLNGHLDMEIDGKEEHLEKGDTLIIHPGTPHKAKGKADILTVCSPSWEPEDEIVIIE